MNSRISIYVTTAMAPVLWGTTYIVFTQTLPTDYPLLIAALRALPAGMLLMLLGAGLPRKKDLAALLCLALANIGIFFALLLVSAARMPGGITATLGACQPLMVVLLAWPLLGRAPRLPEILVSLLGLGGVTLLVSAELTDGDFLGVFAGLGAAGSMALGTILLEKWGKLGSTLQLTAWQLAISGACLLPAALLLEGVPTELQREGWFGLTYLVLFGTALSYWFWTRGIQELGSGAVVLGLISPVVATLIDALLLGDQLVSIQWVGVAIVISSAAAGTHLLRQR